jgi:hypothetical protein
MGEQGVNLHISASVLDVLWLWHWLEWQRYQYRELRSDSVL